MSFLSAGIAAAAGILSLLCCRRGGLAGIAGLAGTLIAALIGIAGVCTSPPGPHVLFMLPTLVLAPAAAFHSRAYIKGHGNPGVYWGFFNLTVATMLALPLIYIHTKSKIRLNKWVFYFFYPAHLILIMALDRFVL